MKITEILAALISAAPPPSHLNTSLTIDGRSVLSTTAILSMSPPSPDRVLAEEPGFIGEGAPAAVTWREGGLRSFPRRTQYAMGPCHAASVSHDNSQEGADGYKLERLESLHVRPIWPWPDPAWPLLGCGWADLLPTAYPMHNPVVSAAAPATSRAGPDPSEATI
ncbi:hypothetical protein F751_6121 [Auxenochlorella protothecoides]|uniref:Uncharacterized protein n=1 Tax=Auxenochlorella protothecoides TaxID=3075 RepID=A0A087SHG2_AUXPR|nr:hypothetical protein F751_6121 [Auxenochlorella protothecoides]KFM25166.1 hypothetical protein F751_6121 [Auxenochlorella protothecoides]